MGDFAVVGTLVKVAITFGLLFLTLRLVGRLHGPSAKVSTPGGARPVETVARSALGRNASVVVVRLGERCFALGVTEQQVNLLTEVDVDLELPAAGTQLVQTRPAWRDLVESLRERSVRQ